MPTADSAAQTKPDTVKLGIYVTSIHDIDFKQKEYNINFWIWLKYKKREFDFVRNLEIPNAKTFTTAYPNASTKIINSNNFEEFIIF